MVVDPMVATKKTRPFRILHLKFTVLEWSMSDVMSSTYLVTNILKLMHGTVQKLKESKVMCFKTPRHLNARSSACAATPPSRPNVTGRA